MNHPLYNDQGYIAESFCLEEDFTNQSARLAFFKINSYKLTLIKTKYKRTREELRHSIKENLFNYTDPGIILADLQFFQSEYDN